MIRSVRPAIYCLAVSQLLTWACSFYSFPALLLRWDRDLGWSKTEITGTFTLAVALSALLSPLAGRMVDLARGPQFLSGCIALGGIAMGALSQVQTLTGFAICWVLIGMSMAGSLYEPCFALITRNTGAGAQRAITIVTLFGGLAGTLSFPLGHMVSELSSWREAALVYAGLMLLVALPLTWLGTSYLEQQGVRPDTPENKQAQASRDRYRFLRRPAFYFIAGSFALLYLNHGIVVNHLLPLLDDRGISADVAVLTATAIGPMQVLGRVVMMAVERVTTVYLITIACFGCLVLGTLSLIGAGMIPLLLVSFAMFQGFAAGVQSIMKPMVTRDLLGPENFGIKSGCITLPVLGGFAFAPYVGSLIWSAGGYDLVLAFVLACAIAGLGLFAVTRLLPRPADHPVAVTVNRRSG